MLLTRLYLRNFRVFEDELELDLPPGLVGVYGPNGAGKSTLLESITWTLWGRARTAKEEVRSSGVGRDCVTEVEFEHEGHLYLVRRTLSGASSSVRAEAHCDGLGMAEGVRDTTRYVHSVLGMDDGAFRASVFAEQKQLAAFSAQAPAERRQLVLQLLGVTPLDDARDAARKDARDTARQHEHLRGLLPDLDALGVAAADADAAAGAAEAEAAEEESAATAAQIRAQGAARDLAKLGGAAPGVRPPGHRGPGRRAELDAATNTVANLQAELESLDRAAGELVGLEAQAAGLADSDRQLRLLDELLPRHPGPPGADRAGGAGGGRRGVDLRGRRRSGSGPARPGRGRGPPARRGGGTGPARDAASRAESLSGEADCPLCGQALGASFAQVQTHRRPSWPAPRPASSSWRATSPPARSGLATRAAAAAEAAAAHQAAVAARRSWEQAVAARRRARRRRGASRHRPGRRRRRRADDSPPRRRWISWSRPGPGSTRWRRASGRPRRRPSASGDSSSVAARRRRSSPRPRSGRRPPTGRCRPCGTSSRRSPSIRRRWPRPRRSPTRRRTRRELPSSAPRRLG